MVAIAVQVGHRDAARGAAVAGQPGLDRDARNVPSPLLFSSSFGPPAFTSHTSRSPSWSASKRAPSTALTFGVAAPIAAVTSRQAPAEVCRQIDVPPLRSNTASTSPSSSMSPQRTPRTPVTPDSG